MTVREHIDAAARYMAGVVGNAGGADLASPTPCKDFDLRQLINHFAGTTAGLARAGRQEPLDPDDPWGSEADVVAEGDWPTILADRVAAVGAVWSSPTAWAGVVDLGGSSLPAEACGDMAFAEILLHGWDLAAATGQQLIVAAEIGTTLRRVIEETAELGRQMHAYGEQVPVPPDASDFDHALGSSGRDPNWCARKA